MRHSVILRNAAGLVLLALTSGCGKDRPTAPIDPLSRAVRIMIVAPERVVVGDTATLRAIGLDSAGAEIPGALRAAWTVSDSSIASVDSAGKIRARKPGLLLVTAQAGVATASRALGVEWPPIDLEVDSPAVTPTVVSLTGKVRVRASCTVRSNTSRPCKLAVVTPSGTVYSTDRIDVEVGALTTSNFPATFEFSAADSLSGLPRGDGVIRRSAFAPPPGPLALVARYDGLVEDFDGTDALYRVPAEPFSASNALWFAPAGGAPIQVTPSSVENARIVAPGIVWYTRAGARASSGRPRFDLFRWQGGVSTLLAAAIDSPDPVTEGRFVAYTVQEGADTALYRYDFLAGTGTRIAAGVPAWTGGPALHYVAPDGRVAYLRRGSAAGVYVNSGLGESLLATGVYDYVRDDGYSVLARTAADSTSYLLAPGPPERLSSSAILPVNVNGWVIYGVPRTPFPAGSTPPSNLKIRRWDDPTDRGGALVRSLLYVRRNGGYAAVGEPAVWGPTPLLFSLTKGGPPEIPLTRYAERDGRFYYFLGGAVVRVDY